MEIKLHPEADAELIEAAVFYESRVEGLGEGFLKEFDGLKLILQKNPKIGVFENEFCRRVMLNRFPYSIFYSLEPNLIWILAVAHQRRRPHYWQKRLSRL